jgi:hypothetical protein
MVDGEFQTWRKEALRERNLGVDTAKDVFGAAPDVTHRRDFQAATTGVSVTP